MSEIILDISQKKSFAVKPASEKNAVVLPNAGVKPGTRISITNTSERSQLVLKAVNKTTVARIAAGEKARFVFDGVKWETTSPSTNKEAIKLNCPRSSDSDSEQESTTDSESDCEPEEDKCKQGPRGFPGKNGRDGRDGCKGKDGKHGKPGACGRDGRDGKDGCDGTDGKDGCDGKDGKDGCDGKDGICIPGCFGTVACDFTEPSTYVDIPILTKEGTYPIGPVVVNVQLAGGGGGGASGSNNFPEPFPDPLYIPGGGGGGSGAFSTAQIVIHNPKTDTLTIVVGKGGAGGVNLSNNVQAPGGNGEQTSISLNGVLYAVAAGGKGGALATGGDGLYDGGDALPPTSLLIPLKAENGEGPDGGIGGDNAIVTTADVATPYVAGGGGGGGSGPIGPYFPKTGGNGGEVTVTDGVNSFTQALPGTAGGGGGGGYGFHNAAQLGGTGGAGGNGFVRYNYFYICKEEKCCEVKKDKCGDSC